MKLLRLTKISQIKPNLGNLRFLQARFEILQRHRGLSLSRKKIIYVEMVRKAVNVARVNVSYTIRGSTGSDYPYYKGQIQKKPRQNRIRSAIDSPGHCLAVFGI